jgi:hypothetical protein
MPTESPVITSLGTEAPAPLLPSLRRRALVAALEQACELLLDCAGFHPAEASGVLEEAGRRGAGSSALMHADDRENRRNIVLTLLFLGHGSYQFES